MSDLLTTTLATRWGLSERERDVLRFIVSGVTATKAIATAMHVSEKTVDKHIDAISKKSDLTGRTELITLLLRGLSGLVETLDSPKGLSFTDMAVLIVEDNEDVAAVFSSALQYSGFATTCVSNVEEALQTSLKEQIFDVVVIDFVIPNGNGIEVAQHVRAAGLAAPTVVMITGFPDLYFNAKGIEDLQIVLKPIDPVTLVRVVSSAAITARFRRRLWSVLQTA